MAAYDWDAAWTTTSINGSTVTTSGSATTAAISNDGKLATEVSATIAYGGTATQGVDVLIGRDVDGTNYEVAGDVPFQIRLPAATSTTFRRTITVPGTVSSFKVIVSNSSGASVTATVQYRQAVA